MKRTRIFTLVMAIFWTILAAAVLVFVLQGNSGVDSTWNFAIVALAFVAVAGNWLRYFKTK